MNSSSVLHDEPNSLTSILPLLPEMKRLRRMGMRISQLKELPWLDMACEIARHVCIHNRFLLASCSMNLPQLGQYIADCWTSNELVDDVMGWKGRYEPFALCDASRPGAPLADFMYTLVRIKKGGSKPGVKHCAVPNATYV